MCTGALDLVSCAGVGMPWLLNGDTGDRVIMGLDMLERLSCSEETHSSLMVWSSGRSAGLRDGKHKRCNHNTEIENIYLDALIHRSVLCDTLPLSLGA